LELQPQELIDLLLEISLNKVSISQLRYLFSALNYKIMFVLDMVSDKL